MSFIFSPLIYLNYKQTSKTKYRGSGCGRRCPGYALCLVSSPLCWACPASRRVSHSEGVPELPAPWDSVHLGPRLPCFGTRKPLTRVHSGSLPSPQNRTLKFRVDSCPLELRI